MFAGNKIPPLKSSSLRWNPGAFAGIRKLSPESRILRWNTAVSAVIQYDENLSKAEEKREKLNICFLKMFF